LNNMADKASLVEQVKQVQRQGPEAKQAWWQYCEEHLGGIKDPNRHEEDTLQDFLTRYGNGEITASAGGGAGVWDPSWGQQQAWAGAAPQWRGKGGGMDASRTGDMVGCIKQMQSKSGQFRACWKNYTTLWGTGMHDPSKYDETFMTGFVDYIAELANNDMQAHAAAAGVSLEQAAVAGMKRGAGEFGESGAPAKRAATMSQWAGGAAAGGEKGGLVNKIKSMQRADVTFKEAWWKYCDEWLGGVRDPNRHEEETLQLFLSEHGGASAAF